MSIRKMRFASRLGDVERKGSGRVKTLPYNRRCSGFVGVDIYDDPHGRSIYFLSTVSIPITPVILGTSTSAVPYGEVGFASRLGEM